MDKMPLKKLSRSKQNLLNRLSLWVLTYPKGTFIQQWEKAFGNFSSVQPHHSVLTSDQIEEMEDNPNMPQEVIDRLVEREGLPSHHMAIIMKPGEFQPHELDLPEGKGQMAAELTAVWCEIPGPMDNMLGWTGTTGEVWFPDQDTPDRPVTVREVVDWVIKNIRNLK